MIKINQLVKYWKDTAAHDYETMVSLYNSKRYSDCLFFGHIVLEKTLKALAVKRLKRQAPLIHDLVRLQEIVGLNLDEQAVELLDQINEFNIRARYPDYKTEFYKRCDKKYTDRYLKDIKIIYSNLCRKLKQK
jgi:HEPN domain-containing protein